MKTGDQRRWRLHWLAAGCLSAICVAGAAQSQAGPAFDATGLRSLIDPGGYSAPASAAAAAGLITALADIRRTENAAEFPLLQAAACAPRAASQDVAGRAQAMILDHDFAAAAKVLAGRQDEASLRLHALAYEGQGRFADAAASYTAAAAMTEQEADFFGAGYESLLAGKPVEAFRAFEAGLAKHPKSVVLLLGAGAADFLQGHNAAAIKRFLTATDSAPADPRSYAFLGICFEFAAEESPQVRDVLKGHLDSSPNDAQAHDLYATALLHGNGTGAPVDYSQAEALLKRAVALDATLTDAHFQLGTLYAHGGDFGGAVREFEATLRLDPDRNEAHYRLSAAYRRTGHADAAEREMKHFRDAREAGTVKGNQDLAPYLSVFARPGQQAVPCPAKNATTP